MRPWWSWLAVMACTASGTDEPGIETDTVADTEVAPTDTPDTDVGPTDPPGPREVAATVDRGARVVCPFPGERDSLGPFVRRAASAEPPAPGLTQNPPNLVGGGIVLRDFTGDGRLDVALPGAVRFQLHVQQPDGIFEEDAAAHFAPGLLDTLDRATSAAPADVDDDGDLDLYVTRWQAPDVYLRNDGGVFVDATAAVGLTAPPGRSQSAAWGDMDGDGDLDLAVGRYGPRPADPFAEFADFEVADPSLLFENLGDGTFRDVSDRIPGAIHDGYTFTVAFHDLDLDGDQDLMFVHDFGWARPSRILWQDAGALVLDDARDAWFALSFAGMGLGVGDLNGDGVLDFVQSSWRETSVLVSDAGTWYEEDALRELLPRSRPPLSQVFGWGTEVFDLENDGDLDVAMGYGHWDDYDAPEGQVDALYIARNTGVFEDRAAEFEMDQDMATRGVVAGDLNGDGYPDLVKRHPGERTTMFLSRCGDRSWVKVRLRQPAPNVDAVGARVAAIHEGMVQVRTVTAGGHSMYVAGPTEALIGTGQLDAIDQVVITWPDGAVTTVDDVATNQVLTVTRTEP